MTNVSSSSTSVASPSLRIDKVFVNVKLRGVLPKSRLPPLEIATEPLSTTIAARTSTAPMSQTAFMSALPSAGRGWFRWSRLLIGVRAQVALLAASIAGLEGSNKWMGVAMPLSANTASPAFAFTMSPWPGVPMVVLLLMPARELIRLLLFPTIVFGV